MSKLEAGLSGNLRGKVGALTYYKRGDKYYVRKSITANSSKTAKQVRQRGKFHTAIKSFSPFSSVFAVGFAKHVDGARTGFNVGVGYNMMNALVQENGGYEVDWSLVCCSQGMVPIVDKVELVGTPETGYMIKWENDMTIEGANAYDKVYVVYYDHEANVAGFLGRSAATRKSGKQKLTIPAVLKGHALELYVFVGRHSKPDTSNTIYVGQLLAE